MSVVPGPVSQDAVFKLLYASPALPCSWCIYFRSMNLCCTWVTATSCPKGCVPKRNPLGYSCHGIPTPTCLLQLGCAGFAKKRFRFKAKPSETRSVSRSHVKIFFSLLFASFRFEFFASDQSKINRAYFRFVLLPKFFRFASDLFVSL